MEEGQKKPIKMDRISIWTKASHSIPSMRLNQILILFNLILLILCYKRRGAEKFCPSTHDQQVKKKKKWYLVTWSNRFGGSGSGWELFSNPSSIVTSNRHDNVIPVVLTNQNGIEERQKIPIKNFLDNISTQVLRLFKVFLKLLL